MPVRMMPGQISLTVMPSLAKRSAKSLVIIETPALEIQYSPRLTELVYAEQEEMLTIEPPFPAATISRATAWVKKRVALVLIPITKS